MSGLVSCKRCPATMILCGDSYRYWYTSKDSTFYHYFDINGRKESFIVKRDGTFEEFKMPDFVISTTWHAIDDSTIYMYADNFFVKIVDKETVVLFGQINNDTLHLLKDLKYIPKEYQKILGKDIVTGGLGKWNKTKEIGGTGL